MTLNFLNRAEAPLSERDWEMIDSVVTEVAKRQLVGRRFIQIFGPLGAAVQDVDYDTFASTGDAVVAVLGEEGVSPVRAQRRVHENIPIIYKDFVLYWRDLETARKMDMPIDVSSAAAAASYVARKEDDLIFYGDVECGYEGLMTATGRNTMKSRDWKKPGNSFQDIVDARTKLLDAGFFGPYALAVNPVWYAHMHQIHGNSGTLEINHVREICTAGVFQTPILKGNHAALVSVGLQNFDIALAQDLISAYLGPEQMNHPFRVLESLVLRLKRPGAICTIEI
ncbi:MAG: bacteriocin family protein [Candidatus Sericytochromatia bacterium]|nr:bacteriocin family protein [Candidatus Sericytochromatia bacterium]